MKKSEAEKIAEAEQAGLAGLILDAQPKLLGGIEGSEPFLDSVRVFARAMGVLSVPLCVTEQVPDKLGSTEDGILEACRFPRFFQGQLFRIWLSRFREMDWRWRGRSFVAHGDRNPDLRLPYGRRCAEAGLDGDRPD